MTNETATAERTKQEAVAELARLLGMSEERIEQLMGTKVRGTAEFSQGGAFHFEPVRERGPVLERIKATRNGSNITRTLKESRLRMTLYSKPGSSDPEADLADEADQLFAQLKRKPRERGLGRTLAERDGVRVAINPKQAEVSVRISMPLRLKADYVKMFCSRMAEVCKALSANADALRRAERKQEGGKQ